MNDCPTPKKLKYSTKRYAKNAGKRVRAHGGPTISVYRCECGWWHLTSTKNHATRSERLAEKMRNFV